MSLKTLVLWLLISATTTAQTSLRFSDQLTYAYTENGQSKEASVYLDRKTSTWLFTNDDSFGGRAEGLSFVVAYASGVYLLCGTDDAGSNGCQRYRRAGGSKKTTGLSGKSTGKRQSFGANNYGWPVVTGAEYTLEAGRMMVKAYIISVPFDTYPLYAYNSLPDLEIFLPIFQRVNYASVLPHNRLVLRESIPAGATLTSLSSTAYNLDLYGYRIADAKP